MNNNNKLLPLPVNAVNLSQNNHLAATTTGNFHLLPHPINHHQHHHHHHQLDHQFDHQFDHLHLQQQQQQQQQQQGSQQHPQQHLNLNHQPSLNFSYSSQPSPSSSSYIPTLNSTTLPPLLKLSHDNLVINNTIPLAFPNFLPSLSSSSSSPTPISIKKSYSDMDTPSSTSSTSPSPPTCTSTNHHSHHLHSNIKQKSIPRKKRECPICHNYFSNLTTHKTIHNKDLKPFICLTCNRPFKRLNDLLRHEKCHLSQLGEWEFKCPFHNANNNSDTNNSKNITNDSTACHHTGFFTRCDTYKNHLKAIHFKYPPNTLKSNRLNVSGNCKECNEKFDNVQDWLINHIECNKCPKMVHLVQKKND